MADAVTADTNTRMLPYYCCLPTVIAPLCCTKCDVVENGSGQGFGACVQFFFCCYGFSGEWTGIYDVSNTYAFNLSSESGLEVKTGESERKFKLADIESIALFSSTCEYHAIPTSLTDADSGGAAACSSGAGIVEVFSEPTRILWPREGPMPRLPNVVDACFEPCLNAYVRVLSLGNFALCGSCVDEYVSGAKPPLKRVGCAFLGARVKGVGIVRLSQKAWRAASVQKLATVEAKIHRCFPQLAVGPDGALVVESADGQVAIAAAAEAKRNQKKAPPTPQTMDRRDRMAFKPGRRITTTESKGAAVA